MSYRLAATLALLVLAQSSLTACSNDPPAEPGASSEHASGPGASTDSRRTTDSSNAGTRDHAPQSLAMQRKGERLAAAAALANSGEIDAAIAAYQTVVTEFPDSAEALNNLAALYAERGDADLAREMLYRAIGTNPTFALVHQNLSEIYATEAARAYSRLLGESGPEQIELSKIEPIRVASTPPTSPPTAAVSEAVSRDFTDATAAAPSDRTADTADPSPVAESADLSASATAAAPSDRTADTTDPSPVAESADLSASATAAAPSDRTADTADPSPVAESADLSASATAAATEAAPAAMSDSAAVQTSESSFQESGSASEPHPVTAPAAPRPQDGEREVPMARSPVPETAPTPAPRAAATEARPTPSSASDPGDESPEDAITRLVFAWAEAWSLQDSDRYFQAYSGRFQPEDGLTRAQWVAQRRARISAPEFIQVRISDLSISVDASGSSATFIQEYRSDRFNSSVRKQLDLLYDGQWKIAREFVIP